MRTHHVLVDFENVQPASLEKLRHERFKLIVFVGASQSKLPFEVVESVQSLGTRAEYVRICGNGTNSLDFHIAYYIGKLGGEDPSAMFFIVSRDTGFDPLIEHLKARRLHVRRVKAVADILVESDFKEMPTAERLNMVTAALKRMDGAKPRSLKTLASTITTVLRRQATEAEVKSLIDTLVAQGVVLIDGKSVTYPSPGSSTSITPAGKGRSLVEAME